MKKLALISMIAAAAVATPAMAQNVTGTINITGSVAPKCFVLNGSTASSTFEANVALGELADTNGLLKPSGTLSTQFANVGGSALDVRVLCTSANPYVSVTATPLLNSTTAVAGYTNRVDYQADVTFSLVGGSTKAISDSSKVAAATSDSLGARLNGTGTNVSVRTSAWEATDILMAGSYAGAITIAIQPQA